MVEPTNKKGIDGLGIYLLVLFINAFVDLGHKITIQNTIFKMESGESQILLTALVNALILIPFILLVVPAGWLSDRYPKRWVMRQSAGAAVVIALLITLCYYRGWFEWAFFLTLLLAVQSALFSPAKYGYLREQVSIERLTSANGAVQAVTIIAILSGMFLFSLLFEQLYASGHPQTHEAVLQQVAPLGWLLTLLAISEWWLAAYLPDSPPLLAEKEPSSDTTWQLIRQQPIIAYAILGLSLFWGVSQVSIAAFPAFAKAELGVTNTLVIQGVLASAGIGILLGSLLTTRISRGWIETGLISLGAIGLTITLLLIPTSHSVEQLALLFLLTGLFGGLLIVPLNALIQFHAPAHHLGRILAGNNWMQNITMLGFLGLTMGVALLETERPVDATLLFHAIALLALVATLIALWKAPQPLIRLLVRLLFRRRYRIHVDGLEHIPAEGGALLLGNHISWIDWAILQIVSPRPIRFVMEEAIYRQPLLKWFLDLVEVIPISSRRSRGALERMQQQLQEGELLCLFPEGAISHNGQLRPFQRGFEKGVAGTGTPIIPFYLHGLWGSRFSRTPVRKQRRSLWWPRRRNVHVTFGPAESDGLSAEAVRQRVEHLSLLAWMQEGRHYRPLQQSWLQQSKRMGLRTVLTDTTTDTRFSGLKLLIATTLISRRIARLSPEQRVGVLLPTTAAGVLTDLAILLCGKTVVNLNYTASLESIQDAIEQSGIHTLYTSSRFLQKLALRGRPVKEALEGVEVITLESLRGEISPLERITTAAMVTLLPTPLLSRWIAVDTPLDRDAFILFSSGSEGKPKGVRLTHRNLMGNIHQIEQSLQPRLHPSDHDTLLASLPLFHSFGLTACTLMPLIKGIPLVTVADPTDTVAVVDAIEQQHATLYFGSPTFLQWMSRSQKVTPQQLDSLRYVVSGSEHLKPPIRSAFEEKFGKTIYEGYGTTETAPVVSANIPDRHNDKGATIQQGNRIGSVGRPLPGTLLKVVDHETLQPLPVGEDGLILIAGIQRMPGYLCPHPPCEQPFVEIDNIIWYKSGDKGHLDKDGFLTIIDRYARFAKIGGEMVSLATVEETILRHSDSPIEVAAVATPDLRKGEQITLFHTGTLHPTTLRQQLHQAKASPLMLPARFHPLEEIPLLGNGKRNYPLMREWACIEP